MRILYIIHENKKGGAAQSFLDMVNGISKVHDVYVITPHKNGYIPDGLDELRIKHKTVPFFWWEIARINNFALDFLRFFVYKQLNICNHISAFVLATIVRRMKIDIIHSNSCTINIGALISELTGIPHVWHLRELAIPEYPLYPVRKTYELGRILHQGNSEYIAISEYVKSFYSTYISDDNSIHVVYNGISSSYNHKKHIEDYAVGIVRFLISGNYCNEKGQIDVAHAVNILVSQGVTGFKVYMAGRGDFTEVKKYLEYNCLSEKVVFCGLVDNMLSLRKKCDVEIVASKTEAFGRVTVEAMRASNPVIGSATGGTTELIQDGVTGYLYEYKDDYALAECMKRFIDNPKHIYDMGKRAYEWAVNKFTSGENLQGVLQVYEDIISFKY